MAKKRGSKRWNIKDLLEAYGLEAVKAGAEYINESAEKLQDEAKNNIERMHIGDDTEFYENGRKRYYVSTGKLKESTRAVKINVDGITEKTKNIAAFVLNDATNPKNGVAYGRIIEFGKHPKPFFYKGFYDNRDRIRDNLQNVIRKSWSEKK